MEPSIETTGSDEEEFGSMRLCIHLPVQPGTEKLSPNHTGGFEHPQPGMESNELLVSFLPGTAGSSEAPWFIRAEQTEEKNCSSSFTKAWERFLFSQLRALQSLPICTGTNSHAGGFTHHKRLKGEGSSSVDNFMCK